MGEQEWRSRLGSSNAKNLLDLWVIGKKYASPTHKDLEGKEFKHLLARQIRLLDRPSAKILEDALTRMHSPIDMTGQSRKRNPMLLVERIAQFIFGPRHVHKAVLEVKAIYAVLTITIVASAGVGSVSLRARADGALDTANDVIHNPANDNNYDITQENVAGLWREGGGSESSDWEFNHYEVVVVDPKSAHSVTGSGDQKGRDSKHLRASASLLLCNPSSRRNKRRTQCFFGGLS